MLTHFSPRSKERDKIFPEFHDEIDLLIATDCISEGQNLQDCDCLINYDIHWNPVRIIQPFGCIDRLGSVNRQIQLVNFWPNMELDEYINLEARVCGRTVNIPTLPDDKREYLEIAVLAVTLKDRSKVEALCHLLHQHIPYPLLLAVSDVGDLALSLAEKLINQSDSSKLTLYCHYDTGWLSAIPDERLNPFFANMTFDALSKVSLFDFYRDLIVRVTKLEASSWTGNYRTDPHQKDDDATLVQRLSELKALEVALNARRNQSSKAVQMNQKIKLNLQAQELKRKIMALKATL